MKNVGNKPSQFPGEWSINDAGYVVNSGSQTSRMAVSTFKFARGEPLEVAMISRDKTITAFGKIFPHPIESRRNGYHLWIEVGSRQNDMFIVWGEGFEPDEEVDAVSFSDSEAGKFRNRANDKGQLGPIIVLPAIVGKTSGLASITIAGKVGKITVAYEWGIPSE